MDRPGVDRARPRDHEDATAGSEAAWRKRTALWFNLLSGSTFHIGGLVAYAASLRLDVRWLVPLAAGNFLYIGASDLVPEVNKEHSWGANVIHFAMFAVGLGLLFAIGVIGGR